MYIEFVNQREETARACNIGCEGNTGNEVHADSCHVCMRMCDILLMRTSAKLAIASGIIAGFDFGNLLFKFCRRHHPIASPQEQLTQTVLASSPFTRKDPYSARLLRIPVPWVQVSLPRAVQKSTPCVESTQMHHAHIKGSYKMAHDSQHQGTTVTRAATPDKCSLQWDE